MTMRHWLASLPSKLYLNEIDAINTGTITYNLHPPIQDGFLRYSFRFFSSLREYTNEVYSLRFITPVEFISYHAVTLSSLFWLTPSPKLGRP
jgi:hypothetical protein